MISGGARATKNGRAFELDVLDLVKAAGYEMAQNQYRPAGVNSLFGKSPATIDVFIYPGCYDRFPMGLAIECTYQSVGGTGAHKMPHRVLSAANLPWPAMIVLGDTEGFYLGTIEWARNMVGANFGDLGNGENYLGIMTVDEFANWIGPAVAKTRRPRRVQRDVIQQRLFPLGDL